jgi:hypothetical protein
MRLHPRIERLIFKPKKPKPATGPSGPPPQKTETKPGRFKVTVTPHVRGENCEWWMKLDDNGEEVCHETYWDKDQAERKAKQKINAIKRLESHEDLAGSEWTTD